MIEPRPAHPFEWVRQPWGMALRSARLAEFADHLFTTRDVHLRGPLGDDGWRHVAASLGVPAARLVRLKQVHGTAEVVIRRGAAVSVPDDEMMRPHADIVLTDDRTVAVAVQVADCVPIVLADRSSGAVAAVHAGWRGTVAGVARDAVDAMRLHLGCSAADLLAAIGPSIGRCCYRVGGDVAEAFRAAGFSEDEMQRWFRPDGNDGHFRLDLANANVDQLEAAGVPAAHIDACGLCTACHPSLFHSYRRDGASAGRLAGVIRPMVVAASSE